VLGFEPASSPKAGAGTALGRGSLVGLTVSHGIVNEVYYPRLDQAWDRDLGLIITDGRSFFSEEKRHTRSELRSSVAAQIAALLAAAECADSNDDPLALWETADGWNQNVEQCIYVTETTLARKGGVTATTRDWRHPMRPKATRPSWLRTHQKIGLSAKAASPPSRSLAPTRWCASVCATPARSADTGYRESHRRALEGRGSGPVPRGAVRTATGTASTKTAAFLTESA